MPGQAGLGADTADAGRSYARRGHRRRPSRHRLHAARRALRRPAPRARARQLRLRPAPARCGRSAGARQPRPRHDHRQRDHERGRRAGDAVRLRGGAGRGADPDSRDTARRAPRLRSTRGSDSLRDRQGLPRHFDEPRRRHAVGHARARRRVRRRTRCRGAGGGRQCLAVGRVPSPPRSRDCLRGLQLPAPDLGSLGERRHRGRPVRARCGWHSTATTRSPRATVPARSPPSSRKC